MHYRGLNVLKKFNGKPWSAKDKCCSPESRLEKLWGVKGNFLGWFLILISPCPTNLHRSLYLLHRERKDWKRWCEGYFWGVVRRRSLDPNKTISKSVGLRPWFVPSTLRGIICVIYSNEFCYHALTRQKTFLSHSISCLKWQVSKKEMAERGNKRRCRH